MLQVRELRLRESELVAEYGSLLLNRHGQALGAEERMHFSCICFCSSLPNAGYHLGHAGLLVAEQTAIAAMDCNSFDLAFSLTNDLRRRFPKSKRASRLAVGTNAEQHHLLRQLR